MNDADVTLSTLFGLRRGAPVTAQLSAIEASECFKSLSRRLRGVPSDFLRTAAAEVLGKLRAIFEVPLGTIVAGAWNKAREFEKYTDRKAYPPESTYLVTLLTHTVTLAQEPRVDVLVGGARVGTVEFKTMLRVTFDGAKVAVRDARFVALHTGTCKFEGTIECGEATPVERTSKDYTLPGVLSFGDGIPIARSLARGSPPKLSDASVPISAPPSPL